MWCEALFRTFSVGLPFGGKIRFNAHVFSCKKSPKTFGENDIDFQFECLIPKLFNMTDVTAVMRKRMENIFDYKFGGSTDFCPPNFEFFRCSAGWCFLGVFSCSF